MLSVGENTASYTNRKSRLPNEVFQYLLLNEDELFLVWSKYRHRLSVHLFIQYVTYVRHQKDNTIIQRSLLIR